MRRNKVNNCQFGLMRLCLASLVCLPFNIIAQSPAKVNAPFISKVWVADKGDGTYRNPVLHADYSDPDAIRVGDIFYMTASSFNASPGLPLLQSKDLVNWTLTGHALNRQPPYDHFSKVQHGGGVWAPSIRFHLNEFYIYYPDPDFGIYMTKAKQFAGPWSEPVLVEAGQGLIDPCPLWDDDGKAYLAYAYAGSRAGIKSILCVKPLLPDGSKTFGQPVMVFDGHKQDATVEGPKFYKRNGWYYIFAPAGGVSTGWQLALRSKSIYGPYERKLVMHQGKSGINGPHQGAWVDTKAGEHWFLHFQDMDAYGRVVHLQPMVWKNDWPVIGADADGDGTGDPVTSYKKPGVALKPALLTPPDSDEFNLPVLGPQWQWQANPKNNWAFPTAEGYLRMFSVLDADSAKNLWNMPNLLTQKFPAPAFKTTVKVKFMPLWEGEQFGLVIFGADYAFVGLQKEKNGIAINYYECIGADKGKQEVTMQPLLVEAQDFWLQAIVMEGAVCSFGYSTDGRNFISIGKAFTAKPGRWVGAKIGLFCKRKNATNNAGFADVDWIRMEPRGN